MSVMAMKQEEPCRIEFKKHGLEIAGPCAQGFSESSEAIFKASRAVEREISAYMCVNTKTGTVEKVALGKVGTSNSTSLPYGRICPRNQRQVSVHTHPTSGIPKFSETDAITITSRMNENVDDGSCVIGEDVTQCFVKALAPRQKNRLNEEVI